MSSRKTLCEFTEGELTFLPSSSSSLPSCSGIAHDTSTTACAQVDLIDMQSFPSGEFKYVLVYQDHGAKFCVLAALKKRTVREVVLQLLSIFATLGPPKLLQTDNGGEFAGIAGSGKVVPLNETELDEVINDIAQLWPACKQVKGPT